MGSPARVRASNAGHEQEVRNEAVVGAEDRGAQGVAGPGPVTAFDAGNIDLDAGPARPAYLAKQAGVPLVDLGEHIRSSDVDGIHLDADQHQMLGAVMARAAEDALLV